MNSERLSRLHAAGQSIWLDYIDRNMLSDGELERLIREQSISGMTSNPTIFEKALAEGSAYDEQIATLADRNALELFEIVASDDVRTACDRFESAYRESGGKDGYVSIEVAPGIENDADATFEAAQRLWTLVNRPNVMIKVPGTEAGIEAVRRLIADGVNVNITLLFSLKAHAAVMQAYIEGLESRLAHGLPLATIASVASFFVSRVDSVVDKLLESAEQSGSIDTDSRSALAGRAAVANARLAYGQFTRVFAGERWNRLRDAGAHVQRPLWASTSTKNPAYRDVLYVEELIAPDTVNTMPPATIAAFADHGEVRRTADSGQDEASALIARLADIGIEMDEVTDKLLVDGLASFQKSFDSLLHGLESKAGTLRAQLQAR